MQLKEETRKETVIQKSRFLACANRCETEEEARTYIEKIRKEFPEATHVCTCYVTGAHDEIKRSSDNGEPSGTAGVPMLEALNHSGLSNTVVCVVRWFGGIKLGTGGLVRAYGGAVSDVLSSALKTETIAMQVYSVCFAYELTGKIEPWLRRNTTIKDIAYNEEEQVLFATDDKEIPEKIRDLSSGLCKAEFLGEEFIEKDL